MIGETLKHYKIEELLGMGGMGVVYRARDTRLQRPVALKILKPELVADPVRKSRFLVEAQAAAAVSHPAIASIFDVDEANGTMFIAMEYIEGRTVGRLIAEGELDLQGAVEIGRQVAEGLARAHEAMIVHRDIKSDNVMVTRDGHAKLLDFGLAKLLDPDLTDDDIPAEVSRTMTRQQVHTMAGTIMGTTNYMSPEQARGRPVDSRSDIFSLGVVLYEMVTGELPFNRAAALDTMHAIVFEEAKPVTSVRRNLPPQVHLIISRCLRKRPEDRYADAGRLADDLEPAGAANRNRDKPFPPHCRTDQGLAGIRRVFGSPREQGAHHPGGRHRAGRRLALYAGPVGKPHRTGLFGPVFLSVCPQPQSRLLSEFAKKISKVPEVKSVIIQEDRVTVILDKAPAKTYLRINSQFESLNSSLFFGKPPTIEIKDDLADSEIQKLVRQPGVTYIRDDIAVE